MRRRMVLAGVVLAALCAGVGSLRALKGMRRSQPYAASYFFDEDKFAGVRPGMTGEQVRDLVGPPLSRQLRQDGKSAWEYSAMPDAQPAARGGPPEWTDFTVGFDGSGRVAFANRSRARHSMKDDTGKYLLLGPRPPARPLPMKELDLQLVRGERPRFGAGEGRYVIQVMASWCGPCTAQRPKVEAMVAGTDATLVLVSIDEDERALHDYLEKHRVKATVLRAAGQAIPGFHRDRGIPQYAVLHDGHVCWFGLDFVAGDEERFADLAWFVRRRDLGRYAVK